MASFIVLAATAQTQTYDGNGATGLGGEIGNGSLTMSDSLSGMYITLKSWRWRVEFRLCALSGYPI